MRATVALILLPFWLAAPARAADVETTAPGLKLTIESLAAAAKDVRAARLVALRVPEGSPLSPFVPAGPFRATWEGSITLRIRGDYSFSAMGRGTLKFTINDEPALDIAGDDLSSKHGQVVKLKKGRNAIRVVYTSPDRGDAVVRLYWSAKEFIAEAVPPMVLSREPDDGSMAAQDQLRRGREIVANLRCVKCHAFDSNDRPAMPELSADVPSLTDVGQRFTQTWLATWINNPHALRADTEMPRVFAGAGDQIDQRAKDVAAYLVESSAKRQAAAEATSEAQIAQGARRFAEMGCVACHVLPGQENATPVSVPRVSLKFVNAKFQPGALAEFLRKPEKHYAWRRMPNFRLSDAEAAALSAFLRSRAAPALTGDVAGDATRGKELFQSAGCASCHLAQPDAKSQAPSLAALTKSDWTRGCVATDPKRRGTAPDFALTDEARQAVRALAANGFMSLARDTPAEFAERQIVQLNCLACHARDRQNDAWSQLGAEIDALTKMLPPEEDNAEFSGDQSRLPLTWSGEKLRPQWMATFIAGELSYKPRPWLRARMPGFPSRGKLLAEGIAQAHGIPPTAPPNADADPNQAEIGRKLSGKVGGFSCVQCHGVGDQKPLAPFEAPAINFANVSERLTKEYFDRWVYSPQRVLPGTRMPQFADSDGRTAIKDVFNGDARRQFDAIWNYLLLGDQIIPP